MMCNLFPILGEVRLQGSMHKNLYANAQLNIGSIDPRGAIL